MLEGARKQLQRRHVTTTILLLMIVAIPLYACASSGFGAKAGAETAARAGANTTAGAGNNTTLQNAPATAQPSQPTTSSSAPKSTASTSSAPSSTTSKHVGLNQGMYESCAPSLGSTCFAHLKQMAQAGFTLVLNYDQLYASNTQELAYAQQASADGIKIIWTLHNPVIWNGGDIKGTFQALSSSCNCSDTTSFVTYVVNLVKGLPSTWGYYIGDEVSVSDHAKLKAMTDLVKQLDPQHPRLFVGSAYSAQAVTNDVAPFVDTADVLAADYYPIGAGDLISDVGPISHAVQTLASQNGKQSAMVLQSFSWSAYPQQNVCSPLPGCAPFPTRAEMHQMYELAIQNAHPSLILWYSFFDLENSDNPSQHWQDLINAAHG